SPDPGNGSLVEAASVTLAWTAGPVATEHDVYVGTTADLGAADLMGRQAGNSYTLDVDQEQTYYWRVDDIETAADGSEIVHASDVWSFTVPLQGAYDQNPPDGQAIRDLSRTLSWTGGWSPQMHAVYFSTDAGEITSGAAAPTLLIRGASLDVGPLELDTTYYWAVDEFYGDHWSLGEVLSFTTAPDIAADPNADPGLVAYYPLDDAAGGLVVDMSGNGNHGEIVGGAQIVDGAIEFDGIDDYIDMGDTAINGIWEPGGSAFSIVALVNPSELRDTVSNHNVGNVLLSRGSDPFNDNFELGFSADGNLILYTDTDGGDTTVTVGSGEITVGAWHEIVVVFDAGAVTVLLDGTTYETSVSGTNFDQAAGSPFTVGDTLHEEHPYSGLLDDLRIYNRAFSATELIQMFTNVKQALAPDPADGAVVLPGLVGLTWTPGEGAVSHDVYIAMDDFDAVVAGDATFIGNQVAPALLLGIGLPPDPFVGGLTPGSTYYWRIDEVDADGAVTVGKVWSFTLSQ
ncbi:MAG: LamG domain-containing protein, partial [Planctomycetes bacterium]|nr:LamG domain-containing protein [Planctomycetota bacterium]